MVDATICPSCRSRSRLRRVWWLGAYQGEIKDFIWQIKYQRSRSVARLLAGYLAGRVPYLPADTLVVPVPTATKRVRMRGYDQAAIIAEEFARHRKLPYLQALRRTGQAELIGMRRNERLKQMKDSFAISTKKINGKSIILVDDVLTTGATLEAAAGLLRDNGAIHVDAAVIARRLLN